MQRELGFALPLSMLSSWLDGIPDPSFPFSRQSEDSFEQRDWGISIRRRNAAGEPQLISASSPMPAGGLLRITLTAEAR
jgi:hypothetical protein